MNEIHQNDNNYRVWSRYFQGASLARRYLFSSLLIALLPLSLVAIFYDTLYVRALDKVVESQTNARLGSSENLLRTFLQERVYELQALADQPAVSELLSPTSKTQLLPQAIDNLFLQQLDSPYIYGVVFQRAKDTEPLWYITQALHTDVQLAELSVTPIEGAEIIGPILPDDARPGWMILRLSVADSTNNEGTSWVGLVLPLNSFIDQIRDLQLSGLQLPLLQVPDGTYLMSAGAVWESDLSPEDVISEDFIPGWRIRLVWLGDPPLSFLELARYGLIVLVLAACICIILLLRYLSYRVNRQFSPLIQGADRVANGDFDTPLDLEGTAEIGYLALAQERMRIRLKHLFRSMAEVERRAVLGQFSAGVAHEIRNPLATIKTTVQALSRKEEDPQRSDLMDIIVHEIDRANDVVHLLLDYARPRLAEAQKINLLEVLETVKVLVDAVALSHNIKIESLGKNPVYAWADPPQMRQIVMNLVMNAIQAMETMGGTIKLQARRQGMSAYIIVKDNGPGVSAEQMPYLTEPFFTTKKSGTGLGLAICNQLAQSNKGELTFGGVSGKGLRVALRLPAYMTDRKVESSHE